MTFAELESMVIALNACYTTLTVSASQSFAPVFSMAKNMGRPFAPVLRQWNEPRKPEEPGKLISITSKGIFATDRTAHMKDNDHLLRPLYNPKILNVFNDRGSRLDSTSSSRVTLYTAILESTLKFRRRR